jgi:hypothetical protein
MRTEFHIEIDLIVSHAADNLTDEVSSPTGLIGTCICGRLEQVHAIVCQSNSLPNIVPGIALVNRLHQKPAMLHKCANPNCPNLFRKLSEGKLFLVETDRFASSTSVLRRWDQGVQHRIEHFWLCAECASVLTLTFETGKGLKTVPLLDSTRKKPAVSAALAVTAAESA